MNGMLENGSEALKVNADTLKTLQESTCFGIAFDDEIPECKKCDVKLQCRSRAAGEKVKTPTEKEAKEKPVAKAATEKKVKSTPTADKKPAKVDKPKAAHKVDSADMPKFKEMSWDELTELATKNEITWKEYGNENINRMRIIMQLKKLY